MTVHFIGAGPGAADLLTLRGRDLIAASPVCLYAGSLVPEGVLSHCPPGCRIVNTAPLSLDEIIAEIAAAHAAGQDVARLHSGDLSVWSAMGEQLRRLRELGIPYDVTPGVPSFAAAAAALGVELTLPGLAQSVVLTRTEGRATQMPERETLVGLRRDRGDAGAAPVDPSDRQAGGGPGAALRRRTARWRWSGARPGRISGSSGRRWPPLRPPCRPEVERTALILVGPALAQEGFEESRLYAGDYDRRYRPVGTDPRFPGTGVMITRD